MTATPCRLWPSLALVLLLAPPAEASELTPSDVSSELPSHDASEAGVEALQIAPSSPSEAPEPSDESRRRLRWSFGEDLELELRGWLAVDAVTFRRTEVGYGSSQHTELSLVQARLSSRLRLANSWSFRFDIEVGQDDVAFQDVWVEYRLRDFLRLRAGRVRVPFGLAQVTPILELKLAGRPIIAGNSKDFRDVGLLAHGSIGNRRLEYSAGMVSGSRDVAIDVNETPDAVGMLWIAPFVGVHPLLEGLRLSGFASFGSGPTRHGFRGRTMAGFTFSDPPTIRGIQWRAGGGIQWNTDRFTITSEAQVVSQDRTELTANQRIGEELRSISDLEPYRVWGWAVEASWHLFGSRTSERPVTGLEVAARFEQFDFGDSERTVATGEGLEDHAPLPDSWVDGITAGLNVYLGYTLRLSLVWQGLWFGDRTMAPDWEGDEAGLESAGEVTSDLVYHGFVRIQGEI